MRSVISFACAVCIAALSAFGSVAKAQDIPGVWSGQIKPLRALPSPSHS